MFGRKKQDETATPGLIDVAEKPDGKGRPTPKRSEVEAANKRPLVAPANSSFRSTGDPKLDKAKRREERERINQGMARGEEKFLPARDRGAERRYARDFVDARWTGGEFFLPAAIVMLLATFILASNPSLGLIVLLLMYAAMFVCVVDAFVMTRKLKKLIVAKFGVAPKGISMYAVMRAFQVRPMRMPKPQVKRGEFPS